MTFRISNTFNSKVNVKRKNKVNKKEEIDNKLKEEIDNKLKEERINLEREIANIIYPKPYVITMPLKFDPISGRKLKNKSNTKSRAYYR